MQAGSVIAERFVIDRVAGGGGMGTVYRAIDRIEGGPVALKLMDRPHEAERDRFLREAQVLAALRHPAIVRYVAHGMTPGGLPYLAMQWLEGEDLAARLARGPLAVSDALTMAVRIAEALGAAHARGVVHRDVKPSNLLLTEGRFDRAQILDFGVARVGWSTSTRTGSVVGTPGYMSPEQARGDRDVDARSDVFALGAVLFESLTGRPPYGGSHPVAVLARILLEEAPRARSVTPELPAELDELIARSMAKERERRPAHGAELAELLSAVQEGRSPADDPIVAPRPSAMTIVERRVFSVAIVDVASETSAQPTDATALADGSGALPALARARGAMTSVGARVEALANGALVAVVSGHGNATDQAIQAARAGLAVKRLGGFVGLATGLGRTDRSVPLGEAIERAATLLSEAREESTAPDGSGVVRIDETTAGLVGARFEVVESAAGLSLGPEKPAVEASARTLLGKPTPCVGREPVLATLEAAWSSAVGDQDAQIVLVTGAPGVGKTRVRTEMQRRLAAHATPPSEMWLARADPMSRGSPYGLAAQLLRSATGLEDGALPTARRNLLARRVARHVPEPERRRVAEFLGELVGAAFPDDESLPLRVARQDPMLMGDQVRRAFEDFVGADCDAGPILIVLEDMHWGDLPSVKLLSGVLRRLRDKPLLVVALGRPDVHDAFPDLWSEHGLHEIRLPELSARASERLVRDVLGDRASPEVVSRVVGRALGNAFFLEELIRAVAEGKGDALPETVVAMVNARLEGLPPDERRVLRAGSVFGEVFWRGAVSTLLGGAAEERLVADALRFLAEREIVTRRGPARFAGQEELAFRHGLVREAAYAMMTDGDRAIGHALAGAWLADVGETDAVVLAEHFERGGEPARAVVAWRRAAEQALAGNDLTQAVDRAERGVACGAEQNLLAALRQIQAEACRWRGDFRTSGDRALEAKSLARKGSALWYAATGELVAAIARRAELWRLDAIADEVVQLDLEPGAEMSFVAASSRLVVQLLHAARYEHAERVLDKMTRSPAAHEHPAAAWTCRAIASAALHRGDVGTYVDQYERAAQGFELSGDLRNLCSTRGSIGYGLLELGADAEAERELRAALVDAERLGLEHVQLVVRHNLGMAVARNGGHAEGIELERNSLERARAQGDIRLEIGCLYYLAIIEVWTGAVESAERSARLASERGRELRSLRPPALGVLARALLAQGRSAEALDAAREAQSVMKEVRIDDGEALVHLAVAECLDAVGDRAGASTAIAAARARVLERAACIAEAAWRKSFLENVPDHARTLQLATAWLG